MKKNTGSIIPTLKDYSRDDDFVDVINESIKAFKHSYEATVRMLNNASRKIG